ncbi:MAG: hypothetical protein AAF619_10265 [Pseudomonadota bacterium]
MVMWPLLAISIAGAALLVINGARFDAFSAGLIGAAFLGINGAAVWRAIARPMTVTWDDTMFAVDRGGKRVYEGEYVQIAKTMMPAYGVGFVVPPLSMATTLSLAFSHPFVLNATRHKLAFPGVFVSGTKQLIKREPPG